MRPNKLMVVALLWCTFSQAETISTAQIITRTLSGMNSSCLHYNPVAGLCYWLVCGVLECRMAVTVKIAHRTPEFVVSAYKDTGHNPWTLMSDTLDPLTVPVANAVNQTEGVPVPAGGGNLNPVMSNSSLYFKEVDIIGNPVLSLFHPKLFCTAQAQPFRPYFQSTLDTLAWRQNTTELFYPQTYTPGLNEIGHFPLNTWGSVYPRTGAVLTQNDAKAGAVVAQRATEIVTRINQPHVYVPVQGGCGDGCTPPAPLSENTDKTGVWQRLAPQPSTHCDIFGTNDDAWAQGWGDDLNRDESGNYVWVLWRPYRCCVPHRGIYVGSTDFDE